MWSLHSLQAAAQPEGGVSAGSLPASNLTESAGDTDTPLSCLPLAGSKSGSQSSGRISVAARDLLHCQRRCSRQTISVAGSSNQHICSPCRLSCALPHSPLSTLHAHSARRAFPHQPPQLRPDLSTRCVQPCSKTGSVCAESNSLGALADGVCCSTSFRGRQPVITTEEFPQDGGQQGALYQAFKPRGGGVVVTQDRQHQASLVPSRHRRPVPDW